MKQHYNQNCIKFKDSILQKKFEKKIQTITSFISCDKVSKTICQTKDISWNFKKNPVSISYCPSRSYYS